MTKQRGYYKLKIGGKQRTLHFSMNFWANFTDSLGIGLDGISDIFANGLSIKTIRTLIYSGYWRTIKKKAMKSITTSLKSECGSRI
jgi:hypothetical protein